MDEYYEKKKAKDTKAQIAPVKKPTIAAAPAPLTNDDTAVIQAELGCYTFSCRIDSGADTDAISENIVNFLGGNGVFILLVYYRNLSS